MGEEKESPPSIISPEELIAMATDEYIPPSTDGTEESPSTTPTITPDEENAISKNVDEKEETAAPTPLQRGERFRPRGAFWATGMRRARSSASVTTAPQGAGVPIEAILVRDDEDEETRMDDDDVFTAHPIFSSLKPDDRTMWSMQTWARWGLCALGLLAVIAVAIAFIVAQGSPRNHPKDQGSGDEMENPFRNNNGPPPGRYGNAPRSIYSHYSVVLGSQFNATCQLPEFLVFAIKCLDQDPATELLVHEKDTITFLEPLDKKRALVGVPINEVDYVAFSCKSLGERVTPAQVKFRGLEFPCQKEEQMATFVQLRRQCDNDEQLKVLCSAEKKNGLCVQNGQCGGYLEQSCLEVTDDTKCSKSSMLFQESIDFEDFEDPGTTADTAYDQFLGALHHD